jgi:hypothetical protein
VSLKIKVTSHIFDPDVLTLSNGRGKVSIVLALSSLILLNDRLDEALSYWANEISKPEPNNDYWNVFANKGYVSVRLDHSKDSSTITVQNSSGKVKMDLREARRLLAKLRSI